MRLPLPVRVRPPPKKDGARFACHEDETHGPPDAF
jgi:hypothetical protein